jgi:hypothetical protein
MAISWQKTGGLLVLLCQFVMKRWRLVVV